MNFCVIAASCDGAEPSCEPRHLLNANLTHEFKRNEFKVFSVMPDQTHAKNTELSSTFLLFVDINY